MSVILRKRKNANGASLIILVDGQLAAQDSLQWAGISLCITRFKGAENYSIREGSSFAVFSEVDATNHLR